MKMGIQLPESEKLNIEDLQRIFDDKSECYKLFWFKAILKVSRILPIMSLFVI